MSNAVPMRRGVWRDRKLAELAIIVGGGTPSRTVPDFWNGAIPWATPTDITACKTPILKSTKESISKAGLRLSGAKLVPPGTVLMTSRATVGECRLAFTQVATNQGFKNLVPKEGVDGRLLMYQMTNHRHRYENYGIGTTFLEVSKKDTERFVVLFPDSLDEQRHIADVLSAVDEQIESFEAQAAKEAKCAQGLLQALLPEGFDVTSPPSGGLGDALVGIEGGKSFMCSDSPAPEGSWGVLKVSAVRPDGFASVENKLVENLALVNRRYEVKEGDLLITRANTPELVGAACHVKSPQRRLLLCDKTLRLVPKPQALPQYLWLWLQTPVARRHVAAHATGTSAGMKNISQSSIRRIPLAALPAPEEQQRRIVPIIAQLEYVSALRMEAEKVRLKKAGLLQALLGAVSA